MKFLALLLAAALWVSLGQPDASVQDQILALEQARNDAIIHGDASTLDRLTSDDYTFINLRGAIQSKSDIVRGFASGAYHYSSRQISELRVRVYGDTAVVTGRSTQQGSEDGRDNSGDYRFTRVYAKQRDHWVTVAYQATLVAK